MSPAESTAATLRHAGRGAFVGNGTIARPIPPDGRPLLVAAGIALLILASQGHARAKAVSGDGMASASSPHSQTGASILSEQHVSPGQIFVGTYGPRVDKPTCPSRWSVYNGSRALRVPMDSPDLHAATKAASQTIAHTSFQQGRFYACQA